MTIQPEHETSYGAVRPLPQVHHVSRTGGQEKRIHTLPPGSRFVWWDLGTWIVVISIFGFPLTGLITTFLNGQDETLSLAARVLTVGCAIALLLKRGISGRLTSPGLYLTLFAVIYATRLIFESIYGTNPEVAYFSLKFFLVASALPSLALLIVVPKDWKEQETLLVALAISSVFLILITYLLISGNYVLLGFVEGTQLGEEGTRLGFERLNPILVGHASVSIMSVCLCVLLNENATKLKIWAGIILMWAAVFVVEAASRGPIISLGMIILLIVASSGRSRWLVLALGILILIGSFFSVFDLAGLTDRTRMSTVGFDEDSLIRFELAFSALADFWTSPLFGSGFELSGEGGWPHNIIVEVLMATGVIGGTIFALALIPVIFKTYTLTRRSLNIGSLLFLQYFVGGQFSGAIWGIPGLWLGMAMVTHNLAGNHLNVWNRGKLTVPLANQASQ